MKGLELRIEDDGGGIPDRPSTAGMGLRIMAHRARLIGATFEVSARDGGGTIVTCRLPVAIEDQIAS